MVDCLRGFELDVVRWRLLEVVALMLFREGDSLRGLHDSWLNLVLRLNICLYLIIRNGRKDLLFDHFRILFSLYHRGICNQLLVCRSMDHVIESGSCDQRNLILLGRGYLVDFDSRAPEGN